MKFNKAQHNSLQNSFILQPYGPFAVIKCSAAMMQFSFGLDLPESITHSGQNFRLNIKVMLAFNCYILCIIPTPEKNKSFLIGLVVKNKSTSKTYFLNLSFIVYSKFCPYNSSLQEKRMTIELRFQSFNKSDNLFSISLSLLINTL